MSRWLFVLRFFAVAPPMPLLMIGTFVVVTGVAAVVIVVEPQTAVRALTPVLLLQLFACSSGFDVPARRGHYDLLISRGQSRALIVAAHWAASALPGIVSWLALAFVCAVGGDASSRGALFSGGTIAAMTLVSTLPWAITLRLPRFAGAIGWLLLVTLTMVVVPEALTIDLERDSSRWGVWLQTAGAILIYPPLLVGADISRSATLAVLPGFLLATAALAAGFQSAIRRDIPLEAAQ